MSAPTQHATEVDLDIGGMTCASCAARVEKKLNKLPGVVATVNYATERARVALPEGMTVADAIATVEATGYTAAEPAKQAEELNEQAEDAEALLFDLRVPVDLEWRDIDLSSVVVEPGGVKSTPLVPWTPSDAPASTRWAIATYTLDCGHQAVELLRQDPDSAPFWIEQGAVDHLAARDARSLARMLLEAGTLEEARVLVESAQANLATHPEEHAGEDDADHA